jgi:hypothetical protein
MAVGAGTAAATGMFSPQSSNRTERAIVSSLRDHHPKNVIFLLGDGMGTQEITARLGYRPENDRRADLSGTEQRRERPRAEPDHRPRAGAETGHEGRRRLHWGDHGRDPGRLASHISLRGCQGPVNMAACPLETKGAGNDLAP